MNKGNEPGWLLQLKSGESLYCYPLFRRIICIGTYCRMSCGSDYRAHDVQQYLNSVHGLHICYPGSYDSGGGDPV